MTLPPAHGGAPHAAGRSGALEAGLGALLRWPAAALVVGEVGVLAAGVAARYLFRQPLTWTDELASILFLWLALLGSVLALQRGEHMRMTALVARLPARWRARAELAAPAAMFGLMVLLAWPAWEYARDEAAITTPALEISNAWRAAALPVGIVLMAVVAGLRLHRAAGARGAAAALVVVAVIAATAWFCAPWLHGLGRLNLVVFFVGVTGACVLAGVPIAAAFGLATFGYLSLTTSTPPMVMIDRIDEGMSHLILLSVPLFVFLGLLIEMTGMARAMVAFLASLLGHVRGGLSYVLVGAMYLVSGISGSKAADMAAVAPALFPEMKARGQAPGELVALLAATGAQTETIPPSLVLITIGSVTGVSIAALFTGGMLPGAVLALFLALVIGLRARGAPAGAPRAPLVQVARTFWVAAPALALPFVIRAAVVRGVATATEVSTIGILYAGLAGALVYRQFDWRRLLPMLAETASLSGAILLIIGAATAMGWGLTQSGFARSLAAAMTALPGGAPMFLAVSILAFIVLGAVLEGIPAIVLFGPLLFPIARQLGVHEVHYAIVVVISMGLGLFSPPFGVGYYAACAIGRVAPDQGMRPLAGYLLALLAGLALVAAVPWISTGFLGG